MVVLIVFAIIFAIVGIIGSVVPGLPGPPMSWVGMLLVFFAGKAGERPDPMSIKTHGAPLFLFLIPHAIGVGVNFAIVYASIV